MIVMSFNTQHCLNFYTRKIDFDVMAEAINKCNPDIVGLNEMFDEGPDEDHRRRCGIYSAGQGDTPGI